VTPSGKTSFGDYLQLLYYESFDIFFVLRGHTLLVVSFVSHRHVQYYVMIFNNVR